MITVIGTGADLEGLVKDLKVFPQSMEKAVSRAINKSLRSTKAEMVRMVRTDYAVKAGAVRQELHISKATWKKLEGKVHGAGSPGIPLKEFARTKKVPSTERIKGFTAAKGGGFTRGYRPNIGIPVVIRKEKGKLAARGVFLARMKSGHVGAFIRREAGLGQWWRSRSGSVSIVEAYGPSPLKILASDRYDEQIDDFMDASYEKYLRHEAGREMEKVGLR